MSVTPTSSPPAVVFENDELIVVDKPAAWLTTPARAGADDPRPCLGLDLQARLGRQIYPVHRLDFEVGGLVMFAKTPAAHRISQGWFEAGTVLKTYRAQTSFAIGAPAEWTEWRSRLVRGKRRTFAADHGKDALTRARVIEDGDRTLTWDVMPLTGRPHQLRFELAHRGWPILGDVLYGGAAWAGAGIALRARRLDFGRLTERLGLPAELIVS